MMNSQKVKYYEPIAITGIGCRLPGGVNDPHSFWRLLAQGIDAITTVPDDRWNLERYLDPNPDRPGHLYAKWGGFIRDIDRFDAHFFGVSPREAAMVDPQHRMLLEVTWEALEDSGIVPSQLSGSQTGVFVGITMHDYENLQLKGEPSSRNLINAYSNMGSAPSVAANRLSHFFNLQGPSIAVDTACSSSLVAVHYACRSIWEGDVPMALAGGINALLNPELTIGFCKARMLSPTGRCHSFAASADGYVRAEGAGMVVLKPLSQARRDGDAIYAIIRGTAVNQDGHGDGLGVPNGAQQAEAVREACARAGVESHHVQYVEAHGTGTPVGDPIEANALGQVLGQGANRTEALFIGSVKSNIGHLESGAGIAGLIKVALALKHRMIPPSLHFDRPNPKIDFQTLRLKVPEKALPWPENVDNRQRLAGINSFGYGGTNAHAVLEEYVESDSLVVSGPSGVLSARRGDAGLQFLGEQVSTLPLSAQSPEGLKEMASRMRNWLTNAENPPANLGDIAYTASLRREHHPHRLAVAGRTRAAWQEGLDAFLAGENAANLTTGHSTGTPALAFVFSGMGQQWWAMGRELLEKEALFAQTIQECEATMKEFVPWSLREELRRDEASTRINDTIISQLAICAIQVGLAAVLKQMGVEPQAVIGHSLGENAAAYVAGILSLRDALAVVYHRVRLQSRGEGKGAMLAVGVPEAEAPSLMHGLEDRLSLSGVNSPSSITLAGDPAALKAIAARLEGTGTFCRFVRTKVASHSLQMEPLRAEMIASLSDLRPQRPRLPMYSTVKGRLTNGLEMDGEYWADHMRYTVRFAGAVQAMMGDQYRVFLEVGAHPVLASYVNECLTTAGQSGQVLTTLRRKEDEPLALLNLVGRLYTLGYPVRWSALFPTGRLVRLPTYPFQRERYWNESEESLRDRFGSSGHPLLGQRLSTSHATWQQTLDLEAMPWLRDHRVQSEVILPGAAYVEMAMAALEALPEFQGRSLEQLELHEPLVLHEGTPSHVELQVDSRERTILIHARAAGSEATWVRHASAMVGRPKAGGTGSQKATEIDLAAVRQRCSERHDAAELYASLARVGLPYGQTFQGIQQLWRGEREALAELIETDARASEGFLISPATLDAGFQAVLATLPSMDRVLLPVRLGCIRRYPSGGRPAFAHVVLGEPDAHGLRGDVRILDETGTVLLEVMGFQAKDLEGAANETPQAFFRYEWVSQPRLNAVALADDLPDPEETVLDLAASVREARMEASPYYHTVRAEFNALSLQYLLEAFRELGWQPRAGESFSPSELGDRLKITSSQRALFGHFLESLRGDGILEQQASRFRVAQVPTPHRSPRAVWKSLLERYPMYSAELTLHHRCGERLAEALRGDVEPLELLFPSGAPTATEAFYQDSPAFRACNGWIRDVMCRMLSRLPTTRGLRILEIGAGTGGTAAHLLPVLPPGRARYVYTDVTDPLVAHARQKFQEYPFIEYRTLDIERDPTEQGFTPHSFDLVLASDVLHATRNVAISLGNVRTLLASSGQLFLLEMTQAPRWIDLTFGLLPGWWRFADRGRRPSYPLMPGSAWRTLLSEQGFTSIASLSDTAQEEPFQTVFLAKGPTLDRGTSPSSGATPSRHQLLLFGGDHPFSARVQTRLKTAGHAVFAVRNGTAFDRLDRQTFRVRAGVREDLTRVLEALRRDEVSLTRIVSLWGLDAPDYSLMSEPALLEAQRLGIESALALVQALESEGSAKPPRLVWVTRGTHLLEGAVEGCVAQAPMWGFHRVLTNERPQFASLAIDLSTDPDETELEALVREALGDALEDEIALRGALRYAHRMSPTTGLEARQPEGQRSTFRLVHLGTGTLDGLRQVPLRPRTPARGEVEITVHAAALNFKDVARTLNLLSAESLEKTASGIDRLGLECSGRITAVGEGVERFRIGDEVMGFAPGCFASQVVADARWLVHRPASVGLEEGATIPVVYLTAWYGLVHLARLQAGERVLIHAGAGGVGLAAIQVAKSLGAEVFATAGSPEKRTFLRSLGVAEVMDSRTLDFVDEIKTRTSGRGVDVVLNSLSGEAIAASLSLLASYGRFIEIGKRDIEQNQRLSLRPFQNNLAFFSVDIDRLAIDRPELLQTLLQEIMTRVEAGSLRPVPYRVFPFARAADAFQQLARARLIGKAVLAIQAHRPSSVASHDRPAHDRPALPRQSLEDSARQLRPDGTYLISGGLGGFSLAAAEWLVARGARHLLLMSRSGQPSKQAEAGLRALKSAGAEVRIVAADVTLEADINRALRMIRAEMPPLRGLIHAAMVLDDAGLSQLDPARLWTALAPKLLGAWHLHRATLNTPLDFMLMFSSFAGLLGNPGQANYAAGGTFLDALAQHRRAHGLPALTVDWGFIGDTGHVADHPEVGRLVQERVGLQPMTASDALKQLGSLLEAGAVQTAITPISWSCWSQHHAAALLPRFSGVVSPADRQRLLERPETPGDGFAGGRTAPARSLETVLREQVARVLGTSVSKIDPSRRLVDLGLDSLMAVELSHRLKKEAALEIPSMKLFGGITMAQLLGELAENRPEKNVGSSAAEAAPSPVPMADPPRAEAVPKGIAATGTLLASDLFRRLSATPSTVPPRLRLFCFPYNGGRVNVFEGLSRALAPQIEVWGVTLPGQMDRPDEPGYRDVGSSVAALSQSLEPFLEVPFAFYGHSLGALMAFELARQLRREGRPLPVLLAIGSLQAPHLPDPIAEAYNLSDRERMEWGAKMGFFSPDVVSMLRGSSREMEELERWMFPVTRRGTELLKGYVHRREAALECPMVVMGGMQDKTMTRAHLAAWRDHTSSSFKLQMFPGNHLFLHSDEALLTLIIKEEINAL